jgi:predicted nucleotidyltransferase
MVDPVIVEVVRSYLAKVQTAGIRARRGIIFGSYARGTAGEDSDIDLVVLAPEFDGERDRMKTDLLWALRASTDSRVEPIGVGERQWEEDDETPIIEIARREGFEVRV